MVRKNEHGAAAGAAENDSSISEAAPAHHITPTARGLMPPVRSPNPLRMLAPPGGAEITARGEPTP